MEKIVVIGSGGHAKVIIDAILAAGKFELLGIIAEPANQLKQVLDIPVIGNDADLKSLANQHKNLRAIIAIGSNRSRSNCYSNVNRLVPNLKFTAVIHPAATISPFCSIGDGTFVGPGATINAGAQVGDHCILNTNCSVDHDCKLEDFSHIAPNAALAGNVHVSKYCLVGIGATVIENITLGEGCCVGAGAVVINPTLSDSTVLGVPATSTKADQKNS